MTRRIVRTGIQLIALTIIACFLIFFVDNRYRVLPQSVHSHLPLHHEGLVITDITVQTCSSLNPLSKCMLDQKKWHRVEKDLYLGSGWVSKAYVHIKRKREEELTSDDKVVVDVRTGKLDPAMGEKAQASEKWESRPAGVWIKRSLKRHASDSKQAVTAVDILFGSDAVEPRPGWELVKNGALHLETARDSKDPACLSIRRGAPHKIEKPVPKIRKDGKFKIMQISDLHLSTGLGVCRDPEPKGANGGHCDADPRTLDFVERVLDEEKPDMVVLSGDQVNGDTAPDIQSALFKIIEPLAERKIPYAAIFGNHDDEGTLSRHAQMSLYESLPYSLSEAGPNTIDGVGNYYVEVEAHNSKHSALTLYMLDTHAYSPDEAHYRGYDWIKPNQITWFKTTAEGLKDAHSKYTHKHLDMAFIHIPLPEYADRNNEWVGNWTEGVTAPAFNTHFKDELVKQGVKFVSCGHDHVNDYCMLSKEHATQEPELWMCYAGGSGFGGYGGYNNYHRRLRVFEIDTNTARISTWKRLEYGDIGKRLDEQIIIDSGRVLPVQRDNRE